MPKLVLLQVAPAGLVSGQDSLSYLILPAARVVISARRGADRMKCYQPIRNINFNYSDLAGTRRGVSLWTAADKKQQVTERTQ
jgi:hypothetical protein